MTTITLSYNERNKTAQAVVKFLESLGVFKILKDDEPNATTIKAIEEVKSGKTSCHFQRRQTRDSRFSR